MARGHSIEVVGAPLLRDFPWEYLKVGFAENLLARHVAEHLHLVVEIAIPAIFPLSVNTCGAVFQHGFQKKTVFSHRLIQNVDPSLEIGEMFAQWRWPAEELGETPQVLRSRRLLRLRPSDRLDNPAEVARD